MSSLSLQAAIVDLDGSPHSQSLARRLDKTGSFRRVADPATTDAARADIRAGRYALALVLPKDFGQRLLTPAGADAGAPITTVSGSSALPAA